MSNIYRKKGTRFLWCWGYDANGRRWDESTKQTDEKAAKLAARDIERRYAADPTHRAREKLTLQVALDEVRLFQARAGRSEGTMRATRYHCEHLVGLLGANTPLAGVTLADTSKYLAKRLDEGAHRHTIAKELHTLTQAMRRCAKLGLYQPKYDPTHFVPDELGTFYRPRDRWLKREEYELLLNALTPRAKPKRDQRVPIEMRRRPVREDRRDYLIAWCNLGLREAELYSIQPRDYDPDRRELRVRGTKTEGADRLVPVNDQAAEVLGRRCDQRLYTAAELVSLEQLGKKRAEETLTREEIASSRGIKQPFPPWDNVGRDLHNACKRAKIAEVSPNDLRRTFCSWLCQAGVPERVCAELMGHQSTVMVRAVYGHLDRESMSAAVAKLNSAPDVVLVMTPPIHGSK